MTTSTSLDCLLSDDIAPLFWPPRMTQSAWGGHVAFGHWLIHAARPTTVVELGTHTGVSYFAFCEAVAKTGLETRCFAVDTWKGDKHSGFYPEDIFERFREVHDGNFKQFSKILRTTFDEAVEQFDSGAVDIIHIDGLHTYEAVRHDFETWLPKLSERAIALFHDTNERREDFGVWRFWSELQQRYPSFEFLHSHGLGVLCVGRNPPAAPLALCSLDSAEQIAAIRQRFESASGNWAIAERLLNLEKTRNHEAALHDGRMRAQAEQIAALDAKISERQKENEEYAGRIQAQAEHIAALDAKILEQQSENEKYADQVRAQSERTAGLDHELQHARSDIEEIRNSTSWRITAPVRFLGTVGRKSMRHLRADRVSAVSDRTEEGLQLSETRQAGTAIQATDWATLETDPAFASLSKLPGPQTANETGIAKDSSKLIAFYLPQYHRIPENSEWWGPGFTEWTNVAKGKPNFVGHHQPNIPRELGYYDLAHVDIMREQVELARLYGVHGFCFYHYWFSGRRILEKPVENFLKSDIAMNFCLCWANENWTRTWDGDTKSVLMEQKYADGDAEAFIDSLIDSFRDRRYATIDDKPLLLVYRAKDIPNPKQWFGIWRERVRKHGFSGLHIAAVDFYDISTPDEVGADSLVEFPPHKFNGPQNHPRVFPTISNPKFAGGIIDYVKVIAQSAHRATPPFKLFRGIMPSWDNTARRQDTPTIVMNARPDLYGAWLSYLRAYARSESPDESNRFVFINAWNEWGEGCYIEPDQRWGLSYLEQTLKSSYYEPTSVAGASLEGARNRLFQRVAEILAATNSDGMPPPLNVSTARGIAAELTAYSPVSEFARKVSIALLKYPTLHRVAKLGYMAMLRIRR